MRESYTGPESGEGGPATARALLARLLPSADARLLVEALLAEGAASPEARRELDRVNAQFALGERARGVQHSLNNPLAALLTEAQLLQLEPLADEPRLAVDRIVGLARRMVALTRQLDG